MLELTTDQRVRILRLNRPEKRNAMTPAMLAGLRGAIEVSNADPSCGAIVLTGAGDVFCAGFDLAMCHEDPAVLTALLESLAACIGLIRGADKCVVLSAHGAAVAGASALAAAADFVVTTRTARLGYPVVRLGISPAVSAPSLLQAIGPGNARARLLDPETISGDEAVRLGLATEALETPTECEQRALALAHQLAEKPPRALATTKRWLDRIAPLESSEAALATSLGLVGGDESRQLLSKALQPRR